MCVCLPCVVSLLKWGQQRRTVNARRRVSIVCCSDRRAPAATRSLLTLPPNFQEWEERAAFALPSQVDMAWRQRNVRSWRNVCVCHARGRPTTTRADRLPNKGTSTYCRPGIDRGGRVGSTRRLINSSVCSMPKEMLSLKKYGGRSHVPRSTRY